MNRTFIIGALVVIAAAVGYYQFSYKPAQVEAAAAAAAAEATAAAEAAAAEATAAAEAAAAETAAAAEAATAAATDAAAATTEAATDAGAMATDAMAALDAATFDAAAVTTMIDESTLDDATKATLKSAVTAAAADPSLVQATIDQVKTALGM